MADGADLVGDRVRFLVKLTVDGGRPTMEHCPPSTMDIQVIPTHMTMRATAGLTSADILVFLSNINAVTMTIEKMTKNME